MCVSPCFESVESSLAACGLEFLSFHTSSEFYREPKIPSSDPHSCDGNGLLQTLIS